MAEQRLIQKSPKRWLLFCDTPLQLYNCILMRDGNIPSDDIVDLVVLKQFRDSLRLISPLEKSRYFDHIISLSPENCRNHKTGQLNLLHMYLKSKEVMPDLQLSSSYDCLCVASPTDITFGLMRGLMQVNPSIKVSFYEDGSGTYTGNIFRGIVYIGNKPKGVTRDRLIVLLAKQVLRMLPKESTEYPLNRIYVKKPELLCYDPPVQCEVIKRSSRADAYHFSVFSTKVEQLEERGIIILDVPRGTCEVNIGAEAIDLLIEGSLQYGIRTYIRHHPRSKEYSRYSIHCVDFSEGLWESVCSCMKGGDYILVGFGSSAQLAPYIEHGLKPYLMFLHRAYFKKNSPEYNIREQIASIAFRAYSDCLERIIIPNSMEEAVEKLRAFSQRRVTLQE